MTESRLIGIKACVFDAYGTLFDLQTAIGRHREHLGASADGVSAIWRQKQLEYSWLRSLMGRYASFWEVTEQALEFALAVHDLRDDDLKAELMQAYRGLEPYWEVPSTLDALSNRGYRLAILSNGSPDMLAAAVNNANLGERFDNVLSVDACGVFKPDPATYQLACDTLDLPAETICFLSSNGWDVAGAVSFGMQVIWINRFGQPPEGLPGDPRAVITQLDQLLPLLTEYHPS